MSRPIEARVDEAIATEEKLARKGTTSKAAQPMNGTEKQASPLSAR